MNTRANFVAAVALAGLAAAASADVISSTFDVDAEGWLIADGDSPGNQSTTGVPNYSTVAGNPGGFITPPLRWATEAFFVAPNKFLGDQSGKFGGSVSIDRRFYEQGSYNYQTDYAVDLTITGASMTLAVDLPKVPTVTWATQSVDFSAAGGWFHLDTSAPATDAEIAAVLASLVDIRVRGNVDDTGGRLAMDNFTIVPTPGSIAVASMAAGMLLRRRRD